MILEPLKMKVAEQGLEEEAKEIMALIEQEATRAKGGEDQACAGAACVIFVGWVVSCCICVLF